MNIIHNWAALNVKIKTLWNIRPQKLFLLLVITLNTKISSFHLKFNTTGIFLHDNLVFKKSLTVKFNDTKWSSLSVHIYIHFWAFAVPCVFLYFVEDILTVFLKTVSRKSSMKNLQRNKNLPTLLAWGLVGWGGDLHFLHMRLMLKCSNVWQLLFLQAMSVCTKVLEESLEVKNTEIWSMESCRQQSIAECTHKSEAAVFGLPSPIFVPLPWWHRQEMRCLVVVPECCSQCQDGCSLPRLRPPGLQDLPYLR